MKVEDGSFESGYKAACAPTFMFFLYQIYSNFKSILAIDIRKESEAKIRNPLLFIVRCLYNVLESLLCFICLFIITDIAEAEEDKRSLTPLFLILMIQLITHFAFTVVHKKLEGKHMNYLPISKASDAVSVELNSLGKSPSSKDNNSSGLSFLTTLTGSFSSLLTATTTICAGGACTPIYGSTIGAILGAFGITLTEWLPYLDGVTGIFVAVSVYILWSAKKDWTYRPFLLSAAAAILIIVHLITQEHKFLLYIGNVMMIGGAFWNIKLNRVRFGKKAKKQSA
jgi:hypothetical protein